MLVILDDQQRRVKATTTGGQPNTTKVAPGFALSPSYFANRIGQFRQVSLNGSPDDFKIDLEITMRDAVAHGVDNRPGNLGMLSGKVRGSALNVSCGFPDDLNVAQDRILIILLPRKPTSSTSSVYSPMRSMASRMWPR